MTTKKQSSKRRSTSSRTASAGTSAKRDNAAIARKSWQTRRANEAARKEREAATFTPKRRASMVPAKVVYRRDAPQAKAKSVAQRWEQQPEHDPVADALDRTLAELREGDLQRLKTVHRLQLYATAVTVAAVALALQVIWG